MRPECRRLVCEGRSGNFTRLRELAERRSCNCTIFGTDVMVIGAFLSEQELKKLLGIRFKARCD